ncbi:MAG: hypothetical protein ACYC4S_16615 [Rhodoferax sp.]
MSAFIVPSNAPGDGVARIEGQHASAVAQFNFDDCRIPVYS